MEIKYEEGNRTLPSGITHSKATIVLAVTGSLVSQHLGHAPIETVALTGGVLTGLVLTPDLDVDVGCISKRIVRRSAGRFIAWLWALLWLPYARIMPHRSHLSHLPLIGTTIRLVYLAVLPSLLYWFAGIGIARPEFPLLAWWGFGGLVLADTLHYLLDIIR
jgi:uncharacterized metal-binding protein